MSRAGVRAALRAGWLAALAALACDPAPLETAATPPTAPILRAATVLEPPRIAVGQLVTLEILVATPPDHRLRPPPPPEEIPGLWVLDVELPTVERLPGRWVHRVRMRLRARQVGALAFPPLSIQVEDAQGRVHELATEERPLEVVSVLDELPDRLEPFGLVAPPSGASRGGLAAAAAGAAATAAAFAAVALVRRRRRRPAPLPPLDLRSALQEARAELARARDEAGSDPDGAAHSAAGALRRFTARRFGARTAASTTEELAALAAPAGASASWPEILALLRRLDRARFGPDAPAGVAALVESTLECVERAAVGVVAPVGRAAGIDSDE